MIYDIGMTIAYEYDRPAIAGRHILRLVPADIPGVQRRITGNLTILPEPAERRPILDFFGNASVEVAFRAAHDEILFRVASRIERIPQAPGLDISPELPGLAEEIADYRGLGSDAPHHFLGPSPRTAPSPEMTAYAREQVAPGMTAADTVEAIGLALHRDMSFDPDATTVDTPPVRGLRPPPRRLPGLRPGDDRQPPRHRHPGRLRLRLPAHQPAARQAPARRGGRHARLGPRLGRRPDRLDRVRPDQRHVPPAPTTSWWRAAATTATSPRSRACSASPATRRPSTPST